MKLAVMFSALALLATPAFAEEFSFTFTWDGLALCNSGSPDTVSNPRFEVEGLPAGTKFIKFTLKDRDVPTFKHGGGWVEMSEDGTVPADAFKYESPCPPDGSHTYEWKAVAKDSKGSGSKTLAKAKARKDYP